MPREIVRAADYHFVPIDPIDEGVDPASVPWPDDLRLGEVHVGWRKGPGGTVNIGTTNPTALAGPDGLFHRVGLAPDAEAAETIVRDFFAASLGIFIDLDRDGCNELIHLVRKARDGAFGKDA